MSSWHKGFTDKRKRPRKIFLKVLEWQRRHGRSGRVERSLDRVDFGALRGAGCVR